MYLFQLLQERKDTNFVLKASFLEIYNEKVSKKTRIFDKIGKELLDKEKILYGKNPFHKIFTNVKETPTPSTARENVVSV